MFESQRRVKVALAPQMDLRSSGLLRALKCRLAFLPFAALWITGKSQPLVPQMYLRSSEGVEVVKLPVYVWVEDQRIDSVNMPS